MVKKVTQADVDYVFDQNEPDVDEIIESLTLEILDVRNAWKLPYLTKLLEAFELLKACKEK